MTIAHDASILALPDATPTLHDGTFVASGARLIGDVSSFVAE